MPYAVPNTLQTSISTRRPIPEQGVFIACHDTDGQIQPLQRVGRMTYTASGYLKESSRKDEESELPTFREAITLKVENHEI